MVAPRTAGLAFVAGFSVAAGLALGWLLWGDKAIAPEQPAAEVRQPDGSIVLERRPDPAAVPAHAIPTGAVVERVASVTVRPNVSRGTPSTSLPPRAPATTSDSASGVPETSGETSGATSTPIDSAACGCDSVRVDLSLIRLRDGSRRVIASAVGGTIIGGVDVPIESAGPVRAPRRWAVGGAYDAQAARWGASIDYDTHRVLPLRLGLSVTPGDRGLAAQLRASIRF